MEANPLVSIVVPVYNVEKHLNKCLNSILRQEYRDIELILVNDGSTDLSPIICEDIAKTDSRVKVIHQQNAGPSKARNIGLSNVTGEYIQFVDSDDTIKPDMTKKLVEGMNNGTQLVICGYNSVSVTSTKQKQIEKHIPTIQGTYTFQEFLQHFGELYHTVIIPSPCNKLYKKQLINQNQIAFNENLQLGEDMLFNLDYLSHCSRIHVLPNPLYEYITRRNSLTQDFKPNYIEVQEILCQRIKNFLIEHSAFTNTNQHYVQLLYTNSIVFGLNNLFHPNSHYSHDQVETIITSLVNNTNVRDNLGYFKGSNQSKLIGIFIKYKSITGIRYFFKLKQVLQVRLKYIFHVLKKYNRKSIYEGHK